MPPFPRLKDTELANLLVYLRLTFADGASPVTAADVAAARARK